MTRDPVPAQVLLDGASHFLDHGGYEVGEHLPRQRWPGCRDGTPSGKALGVAKRQMDCIGKCPIHIDESPIRVGPLLPSTREAHRGAAASSPPRSRWMLARCSADSGGAFAASSTM